MDSALAWCPDSLVLIPAVGKSKKSAIHRWLSPSRYKVIGERNGARHYLSDLASAFSIININIILLATPSMSEHSVSTRNGKKTFRGSEAEHIESIELRCRSHHG